MDKTYLLFVVLFIVAGCLLWLEQKEWRKTDEEIEDIWLEFASKDDGYLNYIAELRTDIGKLRGRVAVLEKEKLGNEKKINEVAKNLQGRITILENRDLNNEYDIDPRYADDDRKFINNKVVSK